MKGLALSSEMRGVGTFVLSSRQPSYQHWVTEQPRYKSFPGQRCKARPSCLEPENPSSTKMALSLHILILIEGGCWLSHKGHQITSAVLALPMRAKGTHFNQNRFYSRLSLLTCEAQSTSNNFDSFESPLQNKHSTHALRWAACSMPGMLYVVFTSMESCFSGSTLTHPLSRSSRKFPGGLPGHKNLATPLDFHWVPALFKNYAYI